MARSVSVAQLISRAKQHADMEGSSFVSDAQWITYASRHVTEFWDLLVQASPPDYFSNDFTFSFTAGARSYLVPSDLRSLQRVLLNSGGRQQPVRPLRIEDRFGATTPLVGGSITIEYIPAPPVLTSTADTVDGIAGWEDIISASMARDALMKEESDVSFLQNLIDREVMRIRTASSNRDRGQPKVIGQVDEGYADPWTALGAEYSLRYRLRGANLELFSV